jgi:hypothetical protein
LGLPFLKRAFYIATGSRLMNTQKHFWSRKLIVLLRAGGERPNKTIWLRIEAPEMRGFDLKRQKKVSRRNPLMHLFAKM